MVLPKVNLGDYLNKDYLRDLGIFRIMLQGWSSLTFKLGIMFKYVSFMFHLGIMSSGVVLFMLNLGIWDGIIKLNLGI